MIKEGLVKILQITTKKILKINLEKYNKKIVLVDLVGSKSKQEIHERN